MLRAVYDRCGVTAADITYVETHGTGTRLGDPIEVGALNDVYGNNPTTVTTSQITSYTSVCNQVFVGSAGGVVQALDAQSGATPL